MSAFLEQKEIVIFRLEDRIKVLAERKPHPIINNQVNQHKPCQYYIDKKNLMRNTV